MPCPHMQTCELFPELTVNRALKVWQVFYCEGDSNQCVRHQNSARGKTVPITLLPNGKTMDQRILGGRAKPEVAAPVSADIADDESETLDLDGDLAETPVTAVAQAAPRSSLATSDTEVESAFYVRIKVEAGSQSEVLERVKTILFELKVGIDATINKQHDEYGEWLVVITDQAKEMTLYRAILRIEDLAAVVGKAKCIALERLSQLVTA